MTSGGTVSANANPCNKGFVLRSVAGNWFIVSRAVGTLRVDLLPLRRGSF
jgi:hypothetical protein